MATELPHATARLLTLLPDLALAVYESAPHGEARRRAKAEGRELTARQMAAVVALAERPGATVSELAVELDTGRAAASELVERLVQKGVVRRETDPDDRRAVRLDLSPAARGLADDLHAGWRTEIEAAFAAVPELDPSAVIAFLEALLDSLKGRRRP
jgi:DNA-binding MarR family transcriptional regulator